MKTYTKQLWFEVVSAVLAFVVLFCLIQKQIQYMSQLEEKKQTLGIGAQKRDQALPIRLKIPSINVDASIEYVGLTLKGAMEVPKNVNDVGWFNLGPRPGERGSAVIAGHFDGVNGGAAVFTHLDKLKVGDKLFVEDDKKISTVFIVREIRTFDPGYADDVFGRSDSAHLNLVTCDGVWDGAKKSYTKRLVVFADIESNLFSSGQ